ncbi:MAG: hypothetical protein AB1714_13530 [Acidobacteriota bacterium]
MKYAKYGPASLNGLFGDFVIYRNLVPADPRVPAIAELRDRLGLDRGYLPRKAEPAYGAVVATMIRAARHIEAPGTAVRCLLYVGDTLMNDGTAFKSICAAGGWQGRAFIGRDDLSRARQIDVDGSIYLSNRWSALHEFVDSVQADGFGRDEATVMVVDMDKTAIGAKGRNDGVIDEARLEAVDRTVRHLLGPRYDEAVFREAYDELKQAPYHRFTADNQDYLVYICLMIGAGLFEVKRLVDDVTYGSIGGFGEFIAQVDGRRHELANTGLLSVHDDICSRFRHDDPTPFKMFRYTEYLTTAARFGDMVEREAEQVLAERIAVTQEVREVVDAVRDCGVLAFGVSDKPDEAAVPTGDQVRSGMKPLHRLDTVAIGEAC